MRIFGKICKNRLSVWGSAPETLVASGGSAPRSRVITLVYYTTLSTFISSATCVLLP